MSIVRAVEAAIVTVDGIQHVLRVGDAYDIDDPIVQAHRWAFRADIEQATAAPGERRGGRR